ncbi:CHAT domain-containing protein [Streptomyces sp. B6B3]|uniref:CHAT domain-containing tetratricopeptide repeat protein n=1 Tax=Streptomyces sp. B6B3 TaxID=3153570 RepID=UPI00325DC8AD
MRARLQRIADTGDLSPALEPQALTEAEQLATLLQTNTPGRSINVPACYALGWLLFHRYEALPDGQGGRELDAATAMFTGCFLLGASGLPEPLLPRIAEVAAPHAVGLLRQAMASGEPGLLSAAVDLWQRMAHAIPADHPQRAAVLSDLLNALRIRYERVGELADLEDAITAGRAAVQATPTNHFQRAGRLSNLGAVLHLRFERVGELADLEDAIDRLRAAVEATPTNDPDRAGRLSNLGVALESRFGRVGELVDLEDAITAGRAAVEATPIYHPARAMFLSNLGGTLGSRFERVGELADLNDAIDRLRAAVEATPIYHPDQAMFLSNLGAALARRFERVGELADLEDAIDRLRAAVEITPTGHPDRAGRVSNLGASLRTRFGHVGELADLEDAITAGRAAVEATPTNHPDRPGHLSNLGNALGDRFERVGELADLDDAIDRLRAAVEATPTNHPDRAGHLSNLGIALHTRFGRVGELADLDDAIDRLRAAVEATPTNHPDRPGYLSNLGIALHTRFGRVGELADLDDAIDRLRAAVEATPTNHPERAGRLSNLGNALGDRFERVGELADLDDAITAGRAAAEATPTNHPDRTKYLTSLGIALHTRYVRNGDRADLDAAVTAYDEAWRIVSAAPSVRIRAATAAAQLVAESDAANAADAAEAAVRLLPEVTPRQLGRGDQQHALGRFTGLAGDAAALALADPRGTQQERATRALRLLEAGRAVLYGQALEVRSDLTDLGQRHPDLAARFVRLRDQLDQPTPAASEGIHAAGGRPTRAAPDRHRLARDFAQTLTEIRALEGFASFALPPTTEELLTEAEQGPVVVFNVSLYRSDALLLTNSGITHLELPHLTISALIENGLSFHQALRTTTSGGSREQRREAQDDLTRVLEWLWDAAAGPVLEELGHHRQPSAETEWPRVWWAPGPLLGLFPLHAAGYHTDPADDPHRRTVMDRVISSHTLTVRALRHTRQHTRSQPPVSDTPAQALVVAMPTTPGLPGHGRLHHAAAEAEILHRHLPRTVLLREPDPASPPSSSPSTPTKTSVLGHLPTCSIVHFACHGASHPTDPSQSLLFLHDHESDPLTVASLAPVRLDHAQLAYLSACRTAAIDAAVLADEAIHLTSAFQLAGFPHVVGTLWEIDDQTAVTVADAFYTCLRAPDGTINTSRAAWALHHAVRGLRDGHDLPAQLDRTRVPFLWAAYLHAGA